MYPDKPTRVQFRLQQVHLLANNIGTLSHVQQIERDKVPAIIFVTAYDRYAVEAFTARALDFLLKPFNRGRFEQALNRAKALVSNREEKETATGKMIELAAEIARQR